MEFQSVEKRETHPVEAPDFIQRSRSTFEEVYSKSNLTHLQLLYWVGQKMRPGSPLFNAILSFKIKGEVDESRFSSAFQNLLDRTDALRTVVREMEGIPQLFVLSEMNYRMEVLDLSDEEDPQGAYQEWAQKRAVIPFDLGARLFDCALVKLGEREYIWYLNQHHINADVTSFMLIFRRLADIYQAGSRELSGNGFEDFLVLEYNKRDKQFRSSENYQQALNYWENKFSKNGRLPALQRLNALRSSTHVHRVTLDLGSEFSQTLRKAGNRQEVFIANQEMSLYNLFGGLFCLLLHQITGDASPGFVSPVHNRSNEKYRRTVGLLMTLCPLQIQVSEGDTYLDVIGKMRRESRENLGYYQAGLDAPVTRELSTVMFNMHPFPALTFASQPVEVGRLHPGHGNEILALHVNEIGEDGRIELHFDFHEDVFTQEDRQIIVNRYRDLLNGFLATPDKIPAPIGHRFDWEARLLGSDPTVKAKVIKRPMSEMEQRLLSIWVDNLGTRDIGLQDNYFEAGGNSLRAVQLFTRIQEVTGCTLSLSTLLEYPTIEKLAQAIQEGTKTNEWSPLVLIKGGDGRKPFFCVHGAGGHTLFCLALADHIESGQPFYAFQARGIESGQIPYRYVEEMAASYVAEMRRHYPEGPYLLGGYSMGGIVAFEMAQQLREQGQSVALLAIIDVPAQDPGLRIVRRVIDFIGGLWRAGIEQRENLFLWSRNIYFKMRYFLNLKVSNKGLYSYSLVKALLAKIQRNRNFTPDSNDFVVEGDELAVIDDHRIRMVYAVNERAFRLYIPRSYPGSIALFKSSDGYQDIEKDNSWMPDLGWKKVVQGEIRSFVIPGNHYQIIRNPHVRQLGELLNRCIVQAQSEIANQIE